MRQKILLTFALLLAIAQGAWGAIAVDGKLPGAFSVSATKQVWFSQGNLQYQANSTGAASAPYTGVWRFATNQYEAIGSGNSNVSASYSGWIDLFGWGSGNQPTQTSEDPNVYSTFVDWGNHAISNGGNTANQWRTLSESEWTYLVSTRPNASSKRGRATINGMYCFVLLPDVWVLPSGLSFTPDANNWTNVYTVEEWAQMEAAGAVCFPAAGSRAGGTNNTNVNDYNRWCCYWSSTSANSSQGYNLWITSDHVGTIDKGNYQMGASVRLVKDVPATITTAPTAIQDLTYTGSAQTLITAGEASGGTIKYSLDDVNWSESLPTGINWGVYTIRYYAEGDASHTDSEKQQISTLIGKAKDMYDPDEGLWTFSEVKTGWTGYEGAGTSISFNGLNDSKWFGSTYLSNDDDGCGYAYLGTTTQNSKYAVYSVYTHTENVPSYSRRVLTWRYKLLAWSSNLEQTTALYAADNLAYLKTLPVDFTEDYTDATHGSGSAYHLAHLTQQSPWGAETYELIGWFGFDNRSGSTAADKTSALLLTQVIGDNTGVSNYVHNWGSFKHVSFSWSTYYYKHITFNANGGEGSMSVQEIENSGTLTANTFTRDGYVFAGWKDANDNFYLDKASVTATSGDKGPVTLYAQWTQNTATLTDGDDLSALSAWAGKTCTVNYTRSFTADKASTVCLPFAYTKKTGDGSFYAFSGIKKVGSEYIATMTEPGTSTLTANTPYLYKAATTGDADFSGTYAIPASITAGTTISGDWTFIGTYSTINWTEAPTGIYGFSAQAANAGITQGQFVKVGSYVRIKPMRAYLQYIGSDSQFANARSLTRAAATTSDDTLPETIGVRLISANGEVTAIGTLHTRTGEVSFDSEAWYTLDGKRLNAKPTQKGIYVNNGKKVVIK